MRGRTGLVAAILASVAAVAPCCRGATPAAAPIEAPVSTEKPGANTQRKLDMDAIFPRGEGRELVLDNCTGCHGFVRIVLTERTRDEWATVKRSMAPKVSALSDEQIDSLFTYLEGNFNDTKPAPKLPAWFLEAAPW